MIVVDLNEYRRRRARLAGVETLAAGLEAATPGQRSLGSSVLVGFATGIGLYLAQKVLDAVFRTKGKS